MHDSQTAAPETIGQDRHLRKSLGYWQLTAIGRRRCVAAGKNRAPSAAFRAVGSAMPTPKPSSAIHHAANP